MGFFSEEQEKLNNRENNKTFAQYYILNNEHFTLDFSAKTLIHCADLYLDEGENKALLEALKSIINGILQNKLSEYQVFSQLNNEIFWQPLSAAAEVDDSAKQYSFGDKFILHLVNFLYHRKKGEELISTDRQKTLVLENAHDIFNHLLKNSERLELEEREKSEAEFFQEVLYEDNTTSNVSKVTRLVWQDIDVNMKLFGRLNISFLHLAVLSNSYNVVWFLLSNRNRDTIEADVVDALGRTPLHGAAIKGFTHIAKCLIDRGCANLDIIDNQGKSPLHYAAEKGHLDLVKLLVEHEASLDIQDLKKETPIKKALYTNRQEIYEFLESKTKPNNEDLDKQNEKNNNTSETPNNEDLDKQNEKMTEPPTVYLSLYDYGVKSYPTVTVYKHS